MDLVEQSAYTHFMVNNLGDTHPSPRQMFTKPLQALTILTLSIGFIAEADTLKPNTQNADDKPNILFIAIDDLNDWVGPLGGHPQTITPNFDRLADRGVTFTNAHCNIPICSPSRTSFMTGLYPENNGVFTNGDSFFDLDPSIASLPPHLANFGYKTIATGKVYPGYDQSYAPYVDILGPGSGNQGGPFTRDELNTLKQNPTHRVDRGPGKLTATLPLNGMPDDRRGSRAINNSFDWGPVNVNDEEMPDGIVARWAANQLQISHDKPFFLGVGFYRPHQPLFVPEKYFKPFPPENIILPETQADDLDDLPPYAQRLARYALTSGTHKTVVEHEQWDDAVAAYLATIHFVDTQIGIILESLTNSDYHENTWIVLLSDHGWHLGEKQHWGKFTPWSRSTRVPLIIVPPSNEKHTEWARGAKIDAPVSLIDIYPTIVELANVATPEHTLDGESLTPLLKTKSNPELPKRHAITSNGRGTHAVVKGSYRYIQYFDGSEELYQTQEDPSEFKNLAALPQYEDLKKSLQQLIPEDPEVAHYIRYDWKKIIVFKDETREPTLYEITPGTGVGGGIGETKNQQQDFPETMNHIKAYLNKNPGLPKRLTLEPMEIDPNSKHSSSIVRAAKLPTLQ